MNRIRSSLPWPHLIFASVIFMAVLVTGFIYQDTLKETVLVTILYIIWVVDLVFQSFDQRCIWMLALLITLVLTTIFSLRTIDLSISKPPEKVERRPYISGRIRFWRTQVRLGSSDDFMHRSRPSELSRLVIKALAYHENSDLKEIKKRFRTQEIQAPKEVRLILGFGKLQLGTEQRLGTLQRIQKQFYLIRAKILGAPFSPDPWLDKIAAYLESLMEDDHGI